MATIDEYRQELEDIINSTELLEEGVESLRELNNRLQEEIRALEGIIRNPTADKETQQTIAQNCSGHIKRILKQKFIAAVGDTKGDITEHMLRHLLNLVDKKVNPIITLPVSGSPWVELKENLATELGNVSLWFEIVQKARDAGGFGGKKDIVRMREWMAIFEAGAGAGEAFYRFQESDRYSAEDYAEKYERTMALRYSFLSDKAPYWYFLEHGNEEFMGGRTFPYPSYGPPRAVSQAEWEGRDYIKEKILELGYETERWYGEGHAERVRFSRALDAISKRISNTDIDKARELVREQVEKYRGLDTLEELGDEWIDKVVLKIIHGIKNKERRVQVDKERIRLKRVLSELRLPPLGLKGLGLPDLTISSRL